MAKLIIPPPGQVTQEQTSGGPPPEAAPDHLFSEMATDYAFFSHASLMVHGGLPVDPVGAWVSGAADRAVFAREFVFPVLRGVPDPLWAFLLFGVPKELADSLYWHLGSTLGVDEASGFAWVTRMCKVRILDPVAIGRDSPPQPIELTLFVVDSNNFQITVDAIMPEDATVNLRKSPPNEKMWALAKSLSATGPAAAAVWTNPANQPFVREARKLIGVPDGDQVPLPE